MFQNVYYGQIGQKDVERLLGKYGKDGSFLLRDSQSERGALCLCVRKAPFVHTYRIVQSPQGFAVETENKKKTQWFLSLEKLIESYKETPHNMVPLLYPLEKSHLHEEERQTRGHETIPQDGSEDTTICMVDSRLRLGTSPYVEKEVYKFMAPTHFMTSSLSDGFCFPSKMFRLCTGFRKCQQKVFTNR